jgi:hypothetical protein
MRLRKAVLPGLAALLVAGGAAWMVRQHETPRTAAPQASAPQAPVRLADFHGEDASADARLLANWVAATGDNQGHAFFVVDKKEAQVYLFTPDARLKDSSPALLGQARADDLLPGVEEKTAAQMRPEEKATPAGRFVAEPGKNADDEDVIWVDYDAAISMHRVRPRVGAERRLERLATPVTDDNRISFGCINLPVTFYEDVARPAAKQYGAIVYVLPEVKTVQQVFGAYDVTDAAQVAAATQAGVARPIQKVDLDRPAAQG